MASAIIRSTVGPSGTRSVDSYHRVVCSAQKYGPLKISCRQTICAPSAAALRIILTCLSIIACLISASDAPPPPISGLTSFFA